MDKQVETGKKDEKHARRAALIGLVGTLLTVCGGLSGALIGGATTLYKMQADAKKLAIQAPQEQDSLAVDTRQVGINGSEAQELDAKAYLVLPELGFIMAQPLDGWQLEELIYADLFFEEATNLSPLILFSSSAGDAWGGQVIRRLRYSQPLMVEFLEGSTENSLAVDPTILESDNYAFYSQVTILRLEKAIATQYTLYNLALLWGTFHQGGVNSLISDPDSQYVFEQVSWPLTNVRVDGKLTDLALERWALFAEGDQAYYIVEMQYVPMGVEAKQVMEDMQAYLSAFRVIR
jgi:hypothetical protein